MRPDIGAIERRLKRATPGPWTHDTAKNCEHDFDNPDLVCTRSQGDTVARLHPGDVDEDRTSNQDGYNADFIAAARTDIPELLSYVEELEDALKTASRPGRRR